MTEPQRGSRNQAYLPTKEASFYLGVSARYLEHLRKAGGGPAFRRHGRFVFYHVDDLDAWSLGRREEGDCHVAR